MNWTFDGRHYLVTKFSDVSTRDGYGWELEDVAPAPGRGSICEVFYDDTIGTFTFAAATTAPVPFELIRTFVNEAAKDVGPTPGLEEGLGNPAGTQWPKSSESEAGGEA